MLSNMVCGAIRRNGNAVSSKYEGLTMEDSASHLQISHIKWPDDNAI